MTPYIIKITMPSYLVNKYLNLLWKSVYEEDEASTSASSSESIKEVLNMTNNQLEAKYTATP